MYIVHGMKGSYVKYGLDPQENALKAGQMPVGVNWGHDSRDGELSLSPDGIEVITETYPNKAGTMAAITRKWQRRLSITVRTRDGAGRSGSYPYY